MLFYLEEELPVLNLVGKDIQLKNILPPYNFLSCPLLNSVLRLKSKKRKEKKKPLADILHGMWLL